MRLRKFPSTKKAPRTHHPVGKLEGFEHAVIKETHQFQRKLQRHHRMIYALLTFIGIVFLWYGVWTLISEIPGLDNPYLAIGIGLVILLVLGQFYDSMVSAGDRRMRKPIPKSIQKTIKKKD